MGIQLTEEQEKLIQQLMKTSADDAMLGKQKQTNVELAHEFLDRIQNSNNIVNREVILAQVYSNLAVADQLVLLNRTLGMLTQIMNEKQSGIVIPNMKI